MKNWLRRNGKWIVVALGVLFISNSVYGLCMGNTLVERIWHSILIGGWLALTIVFSGLAMCLYQWWEKE